MGSRADRRRQQAADHADDVRAGDLRPNEPPRPITAPECPANLGHACDFTMKGRDGIRRCWYCCRPKPAPVHP